MASARRALAEAGLLVAGFLLAGLLAGLLWYLVWAPAPTTDVYLIDGGRPLFDRDVIFRASGLYFFIAAAVGLVLGAAAMWVLDRDEVATLVTVVVAALLGGLLMAWLGHLLGPDAPANIDPTVEHPNGFPTVEAELSADRLVVLTAMPGGATLGALAVLLLTGGRKAKRAAEPAEQSAG
ncbi:hypothetical protein NODU109028_20200 [Nocardioides dubius]|uniref:DUF2567 domain-containing protein n=1 Tax=Nocardioides dubius TaxID=317019 RepID=A0ABP4EA75_9ACTN